MPSFLVSGPADAGVMLLFAHGAGAPMDSGWMSAMAGKLAERGLRTARFEFDYMAARRSGLRKPPPRAERLLDEYRAAVRELEPNGRLLIGGKSLGGRVASMIADESRDAGLIVGLVCLGYPFHPPGAPDRLRTAHLEALRCPALVCQGTRDPFGTREEVAGFRLSPALEVKWFEGDHDLKPRKADGVTLAGNQAAVAAAIADWSEALN
jgi:predicted alpha/beta-hydrolase family hydrolase